jgi:hypothetical protein
MLGWKWEENYHLWPLHATCEGGIAMVGLYSLVDQGRVSGTMDGITIQLNMHGWE